MKIIAWILIVWSGIAIVSLFQDLSEGYYANAGAEYFLTFAYAGLIIALGIGTLQSK